MDFEPFLKKYYSSFPEERLKSVEAFCKNANSIFGDNDLSDVCNNRTAIYSLFYISGDCIGKSQFFKAKGYIKNLYDWLLSIGVASQETVAFISKLTLGDVISDGELLVFYFTNLDEVLNYIDKVGSKYGLNAPDDLLNIKSMVILSWHGLTREDVTSVLKADLDKDSCTVQVHTRSNKQILQLNKNHFDILWRFSALDKHAGFPSGKVQYYKESPYLMRSARQERMEPNNIACSFKRFNEVSTEFGKRLNFIALRKNGLFCKVLESEDEYKTVGLAIKALINCDKTFAFGYKFAYDKWKSIYAKGGR